MPNIDQITNVVASGLAKSVHATSCYLSTGPAGSELITSLLSHCHSTSTTTIVVNLELDLPYCLSNHFSFSSWQFFA